MKTFLATANMGNAIRVDLDALWQKALSEGRDVSIRVKRTLSPDFSKSLDDLGEYAVISAWARGRGKKG